ncbi:MAG: relaxase/mobilization nuclease domain-containing protein [Pseudomonadota bacterium]
MIIVASQRSGARALADHLMNDRDNDHVTLAKVEGFVANDLHGALDEAHAISKATRCKQFLFSVSLNPPEDAHVSDEGFEQMAQRVAKTLQLQDQPHAMVVHEKQGRRHAHAVWSRIDTNGMKAVNLPHFKNKLRDLSRETFLENGWELPDGLATHGKKSPLNFTLEEWQQAKRSKVDPREIKQIFQKTWERTDNLSSFKNVLEGSGYFLAKGDRRGFVALDVDGNVYAISKWTGLKVKDVEAKLGHPKHLKSVDETQADIRSKVSLQTREFIAETKNRHFQELDPHRQEHRTLTQAHRDERMKLQIGQEKRWIAETKVRSSKLNKGLRGLFDRFSGKAKVIRSQNELDARVCAIRDQKQRDFMVREQIKERRALQERVDKILLEQKRERQHLAQTIARTMRQTKLFKHYKRAKLRKLEL